MEEQKPGTEITHNFVTQRKPIILVGFPLVLPFYTLMHVHTHIHIYSSFSFFLVITFYKVAMNAEWVNTEPLFPDTVF